MKLTSGHEERNTPWAHSRRRYNAGYGIKSIDQLEDIIAFFEARQGRLHSFRWRDPFDYKSCPVTKIPMGTDQLLGYGNESIQKIQLVKNYMSGGYIYQRPIRKPVKETVFLTINGSVLSNSDYSIDYRTGLITLSKKLNTTDEIRAGYMFDVLVRFDADNLDLNLSSIRAGDIPNITVVEVLEA